VVASKLTAHQYTALRVLERHPGITSAELARNLFVRAQTMAEMVTYVLGRGLISRERDGTNLRTPRSGACLGQGEGQGTRMILPVA
jgi:DNA-binding MarR family transcriptional regulator